MKYKKSIYNSVVDEIDNGVLVLNTISSAILWLPQEMWNIQEYSDTLEGNWKTAIECGIWVESGKDEYAELHKCLQDAMENNPEDIVITIAPTYACNMRCEYCFQHDQNEPIMSKEVADLVMSSTIEIMSRYRTVHITWFGGEPLLAMDVIEYLSKRFISFCETNGIEYSADVISNGTLLTKKVAERLVKCKVRSIQVTLDGISHDKVRKMKDGSSSYTRIIDNIAHCVNDFIIVVRSNVSESNIPSIKAMIDDLMLRHELVNKVHFSFFPVTDFEGKNHKGCDYQSFCKLTTYSTGLIDLVKHVIQYQDFTTVTNFFFTSSTVPCEVICKDTVCFDAHGDVYKCGLSMQNTDMRIGNILHTSIDAILNNGDQNGWLSFQWNDECRDCNFLPMCHSGCIYRKRASGKTKLCSINQSIHHELMKIVYEQLGGSFV